MKQSPIHFPEHDPELTHIIHETLHLQDLVNAQTSQLQTEAVSPTDEEEAVENSSGPQVSFATPEIAMTQTTTKAVKTHEEILAKNTNYVFIFGYTGSGKSTVLTAINMYMRQHYRVILNQGGNQAGIRLIHRMMRDIEEGQFPQATTIGQITEYDTSFLMNGEDVNLTFLEMAGEDLRKVDVADAEDELPESVKAYLTCPGISISFLIVADYERVVQRTEDKLILQFLSYLYQEKIDLSRVGVILSKFDRGRTEQNVEEVIKTYLPQVDKWLSSGDIAQPRIFPFSIGEVTEAQGSKDAISHIDLEDCSEVVPWLHHVLSLPGVKQPQMDREPTGLKKWRNLLNW
ncbi:MAG: hypothetical protein AAF399_20295 [Bacteroidota bacterium]